MSDNVGQMFYWESMSHVEIVLGGGIWLCLYHGEIYCDKSDFNSIIGIEIE